MTDRESLEDRILRASHEPGADLELLAHEVGASTDAQAYLVELVETLAAISPTSAAAERAAALLEAGLAVAAELGADEIETAAGARRESEVGDSAERRKR